MRAVHTTNVPALLRWQGGSRPVTIDQAGNLVLIRDDGDHLNTDFRAFQMSMGRAAAGDRPTIGTSIPVGPCEANYQRHIGKRPN